MSVSTSTENAPPLHVMAAVGVLSASLLAYEVLLIRLFAIVDWHHLAFLVISLGMLGYGASGTAIALGRRVLVARTGTASALCAAGFAVASQGALLVSQRIPLNSLEIFWSPTQSGALMLLTLLFAVPFFCGASAIGLTLSRSGAHSPRVYRADLLGAAAGAAGATLLLYLVHPVTALVAVGCAGAVSAVLFAPRPAAIAALPFVVAALALVRPLLLPLRISQFKELSQTLLLPGTHVVEERSSPLSLLTAVTSTEVPFRHAPGLSLSFGGSVGEQIGVFSDGSGMSPIVRWNGDPDSVAWLDWVPSAVAWHVHPAARSAAVVGAGGGSDVLSALVHGSSAVTAVELNPQMVGLVRDRFAGESGGIYADPRVRVVTGEARSVLRRSEERWDVIVIGMVDAMSAASAGVQALTESTLYTVEATEEMLGRLQPGGLLVVTRWMEAPPRQVLKLIATAAFAVERRGHRPARRMALIRGWNTTTLVVKNGDFVGDEIAALRRFCDERSFDIDLAPGLRREETNRYNVLDGPLLFDTAAVIVAGGEERARLLEEYRFDIRPATDDRPWFFHTFRWRAFPELLRLRARGGVALLEWGYVVLLAGLLQAVAASALLILAPLLLLRGGKRERREPAWRLVAWFGAIGFAFLFVEIAFIHRLTMILGNPVHGVALVLASFLLFAGLGSGFSARIPLRHAAALTAGVAVVVLATLLVARALPLAAGPGMLSKAAISIALIAPLAFAMGLPFPLGLRRLAAADPAAIPWAWGVNGAASVIGAGSATLVAVHLGFTALVAAAALLYALAALSSRRA